MTTPKNTPSRLVVALALVGGALSASWGPSLSAAGTSALAVQDAIPAAVFANVADYGFMWWSNGPASSHYAIKTSHYGLVFDCNGLRPTVLFPVSQRRPESLVLSESWAESFPVPGSAGLACQMVTGGGTTNVVKATGRSADVRLVECGKFFQRRWQLVDTGSFGAKTNWSGLEVAAWPDRLSFVLRLVSTNAVTNATLTMALDLGNAYTNLMRSGAGFALADEAGSGFVLLKSSGSSTLQVDAARGRVVVSTQIDHWAAGEECSVGLAILPAAKQIGAVLAAAVASETAPLSVRAVNYPGAEVLRAPYDPDRGWHNVMLNTRRMEGADAMLRTRLSITNETTQPRVIRLNFDGMPFYIPGISAVLRDLDGNPTGIPVQLSKNWHGAAPDGRFYGGWFHGLTMLTVPAQTSLNLELTMVGQNWGGMPAATHSQLSVIGYGGAQQWDEAALGNYGETFCYDVEHVLTDNDCTDSRPILMLNVKGEKGQWCGNHGGAQFLRYYDAEGTQRRHSRMRTHYVRYCPNLAEAVFAGQSDDGAMEFSFSAGLYRSDDYSRGVHRIRMRVKSDFSFSRLVFYQQAADTYAYGNGESLAYGNATNPTPLRRWTASSALNRNIGEPVELTGPMSWAMTLESTTPAPYTPANRGFVIRSWKARLSGQDEVRPYLVERSTSRASVFDLVPPPGTTSLKAGDYLDAEIVRFYVPRFAKDYYGPNENFRRALTNYQDSWQLALREAAGNNLTVTPHRGKLERTFPIQIAAEANRAEFSVTGGIGSVPVTFTGLSDYRAPVLEEKLGDKWIPQNQAVHGRDFWQTDFNAERGGWEVTFNLGLDDTNCVDLLTMLRSPSTRTFRFRLASGETRVYRVLPVGDSITEGGRSFSNYRYPLWQKLSQAGYQIQFVGSRSSESPIGPLRHEGYGGKNAEFIASLLEKNFRTNIADIVLIHAGHNHFNTEAPVRGIVAATEKMVETLRGVNPDVIVLIAQVIPSGKLPKYEYIPALNAALSDLAIRLSTKQSPITVVDMADGFDWHTDTVADLVHPNARGAEKMAAKWFLALTNAMTASPSAGRNGQP